MSGYGNNWIHSPELTIGYDNFIEAVDDHDIEASDVIWEYQVVEDKRSVSYGAGEEKLSGRGEIYMETLLDWIKDLKEKYEIQIAITRNEVSDKVMLEVGFGEEVSEEEYRKAVETPHTPNYEDLENMINSGVYWFEESNTGKLEKIFLD